MDNFIAGFAYGATSVIVGQPLDTIKTRMQALGSFAQPAQSSWGVAKDLLHREGVRGLYRGGTSLFIGGGLIRSAQFGVYNFMFTRLEELSNSTPDERRVLRVLDPIVVMAGFAGGIGRGLVEAPFEFVKTRIQVQHSWSFKELLSGSMTTMVRNSFLFSSFVIYLDFSKQLTGGSLGAFLTGALCSNLAWLTIWPLDVVKSQIQSGNYQSKSIPQLILDNVRSGNIYRGLVPGLSRSFIANGCSMVVYEKVLKFLQTRTGVNE